MDTRDNNRTALDKALMHTWKRLLTEVNAALTYCDGCIVGYVPVADEAVNVGEPTTERISRKCATNIHNSRVTHCKSCCIIMSLY